MERWRTSYQFGGDTKRKTTAINTFYCDHQRTTCLLSSCAHVWPQPKMRHCPPYKARNSTLSWWFPGIKWRQCKRKNAIYILGLCRFFYWCNKVRNAILLDLYRFYETLYICWCEFGILDRVIFWLDFWSSGK